MDEKGEKNYFKNFKPKDTKFNFALNPSFQNKYDTSEERRVVMSKENPEAIAASWENDFSHPTAHNKDKFTYLIHGFQGRAGDIVQKLFVLDAMKKGTGGDTQQDIDLLTEPHKIGDKKIISASVIDQDHRATFGESGLILKTPSQNVLDVSPQDLGTDFVSPDKVINTLKRSLCTVQELLKASSSSEWNEVRLLGSTDAGKVSIDGVWVKVDEQGKPLDEDTARQLKQLSIRLNISYVTIVEKKEKADFQHSAPAIHTDIVTPRESGKNKVEYVPWAFSVNRDGLRYFIDFKRNNFFVIDEYKKARQMTPQEFLKAKELIESELEESKTEEVRSILDSLQEKFDASQK